MIELVSHDRCITCQACVVACPENVFDKVPHKPPVIARPDDCQTCFLCELYCPHPEHAIRSTSLGCDAGLSIMARYLDQ
jgi:NAD-dependent dihydropyrimidine dehydrogenase PreA subunit